MQILFRYLSSSPDEFELWGFNAHATSTPKGDKAEVLAITRFLQASPQHLLVPEEPNAAWVTSHKGNVGHLLGGAGSTEAVYAVMALREGVVPATVNLQDLDDFPGMDDRYICTMENGFASCMADISLVVRMSEEKNPSQMDEKEEGKIPTPTV